MTWLILILATFSLVISIFELVYQDQLEDNSANLIYFLQKLDYKAVDAIFLILEIVTATIFIYISLIMYFCSNRVLGSQAVFIGILCASISALLKMCYAHPRPLWKYDFIRPIRCTKDFGYPSGHAFSAGGIIFFLSYH